MNTSTARYFGIEKAIAEPSFARRVGYRLLGEIHISGRIRLYHVLRQVGALKLPNSGVRLLDAGTARGDVALHFARVRPLWRVHGIDLDAERIARCRAAASALGLKNTNFRQFDLLQFDAEAEYDLITSTDVLEHIEDDHRALANLARALRAGGYLLLTFPAWPGRRHLRLLHWLERRRGSARGVVGHVREGYDAEGATELVRAAGLELVKLRWTYGFFGTLAHDLFYIMGDSEVSPLIFALALPFFLSLSFLEGRSQPRRGCALLLVARKPA